MMLSALPPYFKAPPPPCALPDTPRITARTPRVIRLIWPPDDYGIGVFTIRSKNDDYYYIFKEIPCDIGGRGFAVHRLGLGEVYHVRINGRRDSTCECLGFLAHGHCKHIQGLTALIGHELL